MRRPICGNDDGKPKDGKTEKPKKSDQPPGEEEFGGGDFVSPVHQPSTDDDRPLD